MDTKSTRSELMRPRIRLTWLSDTAIEFATIGKHGQVVTTSLQEFSSPEDTERYVRRISNRNARVDVR